MRFRISPDMTIALGATVMGPNEIAETESVQIVASRHPSPEEVDAYERVLGDVLAGDAPFSRASIMSRGVENRRSGAESCYSD
jgi:glucose-6-phosphate 1-dehydrogenase